MINFWKIYDISYTKTNQWSKAWLYWTCKVMMHDFQLESDFPSCRQGRVRKYIKATLVTWIAPQAFRQLWMHTTCTMISLLAKASGTLSCKQHHTNYNLLKTTPTASLHSFNVGDGLTRLLIIKSDKLFIKCDRILENQS